MAAVPMHSPHEGPPAPTRTLHLRHCKLPLTHSLSALHLAPAPCSLFLVLQVHSLAWNCDGSLLASGSADKTAIVYAIRGRLVCCCAPRLIILVHTPAPHHLSFHLSRPSTQSKDGEMTGHTNTVDQVCWNPTDRHVLATASADKTVRIWDARKGSLVGVGASL